MPNTLPLATLLGRLSLRSSALQKLSLQNSALRRSSLQGSALLSSAVRLAHRSVSTGSAAAGLLQSGVTLGKPLECRRGRKFMKVLAIKKDPNRTPFICLVAGTRGRRWLEAVHGVEEGQIIKTSAHIPDMPVRPEIGDAHPVGALPANTQVCLIEFYPGRGASLVKNAAGSYATVLRQQGDFVVVKLPSKHEISIRKECMVTVGRLSNVDHHKEQIGTPNEARRRGIKQSSGLWHRKTGYQGRKIRPLPPMKQHTEPYPDPPAKVKLTLTKGQLSGHFGGAHPDANLVAHSVQMVWR